MSSGTGRSISHSIETLVPSPGLIECILLPVRRLHLSDVVVTAL